MTMISWAAGQSTNMVFRKFEKDEVEKSPAVVEKTEQDTYLGGFEGYLVEIFHSSCDAHTFSISVTEAPCHWVRRLKNKASDGESSKCQNIE